MTTKEKIGTVVSNKMDKTIVITVEDKYSHPLYVKTLKQTKRFMAQTNTLPPPSNGHKMIK